MLKKEILGLFYSLLDKWRDAEETVIDDRGNLEDYKDLDRIELEYKESINVLLNKL